MIGRGGEREYPNLNHITEADLLHGYRGLRAQSRPQPTRPVSRVLRDQAQLAARTHDVPVPEPLLLRGRRCPCGDGR